MFDLVKHLKHQRYWSEKTFGPGARTQGIINHILSELEEIDESHGDLEEWIDVVILAFDGAWRSGYSALEIVTMLQAKQLKNERREWPDWRQFTRGEAIEHIKK